MVILQLWQGASPEFINSVPKGSSTPCNPCSVCAAPRCHPPPHPSVHTAKRWAAGWTVFWQLRDSQPPLLDSDLPINQCIYLYHNKAIIYIHNLSEMTTPHSNITGNIYALQKTPGGSQKWENEWKDSRKLSSSSLTKASTSWSNKKLPSHDAVCGHVCVTFITFSFELFTIALNGICKKHKTTCYGKRWLDASKMFQTSFED